MRLFRFKGRDGGDGDGKRYKITYTDVDGKRRTVKARSTTHADLITTELGEQHLSYTIRRD